MSPISTATAILAASSALCAAGMINVVHLGPPDVLRFEVACSGGIQAFDLSHGGTSGQFILPEKSALISTPNQEIPALKIPATADTYIAVLSPDTKGFRWTLIPSKPTPEKWSLRAINLGLEITKLAQAGEPLEIKPGSTAELVVQGKSRMSLRLEDGDKLTYDGSEPCAVLAVIFRKKGKWTALFVPDR